MSREHSYLNHLIEAGRYIPQTTRWMQWHWPDLVKDGVSALPFLKPPAKGRFIVKTPKCGINCSHFRESDASYFAFGAEGLIFVL